MRLKGWPCYRCGFDWSFDENGPTWYWKNRLGVASEKRHECPAGVLFVMDAEEL